jgi:PKD repeat protein
MFAALDVCGHEITHGLTDWTANLVYSYESGALNESFSDIFGTAIENFARPGNWNWKIGEDLTTSGFGLRSMQSPNSYGDPDTYKGSMWYSGSGDNGGVHTNSGVPNYWFYLLTVGGTGTNDLGDAYNIQGLGIYNAGLIAYRALAFYFTPNTDFASARIGCIQAAKDIFGDCSNEMIQTANAWHAVGVGKKVSASAVQPNFTSKVFSFCSLPATVSFSNTTPYGYNYKWSFGDGGASSAVDPIHTYTAAGNYNVQLKADGCGGTDSLLKTAFITIDLPAAPAVAGSTVCEGNPASISATANGLLNWYASPSSTTSLQSGTMLSIPSLTSTVTYYVDNR